MNIKNNITTGNAQIFSLNSSGEGVGIDQETGNTIQVPFVLPGEKIQFECQTFRRKKNYKVTHLSNESSERINSICKHFSTCGGCMLQHMSQSLYKEFKQSLITNALIEVGLDPFVLDNITILPFGRRRRANLDAIRKGADIFLGFHKFKSHQIINITECHTMDPILTSLLAPLRAALMLVLEPFQKAKIFFTNTVTGVDISLDIQGVSLLSAEKRLTLKIFAESNNLARLIFKYRKIIDVIYQIAEPMVQFSGINVHVDAYSFLQATAEADTYLAKFVCDVLLPDTKRIADLFCGRGTLSLPLSNHATISGYEFDKSALAALQQATPLAINTIHLYQRDLFQEPLTRSELDAFEVIVIDPPRAGSEAQCTNMAHCNTKQIIYVSCNPETFARDAKILTNGHFNLVKVHGIDQFAWSPHIEVVGVFEKK